MNNPGPKSSDRALSRSAAGTVARLALAMALLATAGGCRQDMHDQPKYQPFERNDFFADQRASRPILPGTVARDHLAENTAVHLGERDGTLVQEVPFAIDRALLARGRERYDIFCSPCHDRVGSGNGMIVQRGYKQPTSFHTERLRLTPDGYIFQAITNGFGVMPSYAVQIPVEDRWAIVAYVRALQLSQSVKVSDLSAADLEKLRAHGKAE